MPTRSADVDWSVRADDCGESLSKYAASFKLKNKVDCLHRCEDKNKTVYKHLKHWRILAVSGSTLNVYCMHSQDWMGQFFQQFLFLFTIFILHSRESELYRYVLDGISALAWELLLPRCLGYLSST